MASPEIKRNFFRILPFGLIWLFFSFVYSLLERGLLGELNHYPSTGNPYNFGRTIFVTAAIAFLLGMIIGTLEILYVNKFFQRRRFAQKLVLKTLLYVAFITVFLALNTVIFNALELNENIFSSIVWNNFQLFFFQLCFLERVGVYRGHRGGEFILYGSE